MAYWRISCSYILTWFPLFDKTITSRLSTNFVKFSISSAPILGLKNAIPQLIFGCILFTTSVKLPFQQTPEILYWIKVRWWGRPCHQFFALESNFCQVFNSGTSSMRRCVVLHEDYILPGQCWAFAAVPRNKIILKKVSVRYSAFIFTPSGTLNRPTSSLPIIPAQNMTPAIWSIQGSSLHSSVKRTVWKPVLTSLAL